MFAEAYLQYRADYAKAEPLFRSALFIDEARLEANHPDVGLGDPAREFVDGAKRGKTIA